MISRNDPTRLGIAAPLALLLLSCQPPGAANDVTEAGSDRHVALPTAVVWPAGLRVLDDGYPRPGDPCRRLGESAATADYLDDSAILLGCPGAATAAPTLAILAAARARVVGTVGDITLVSVAQHDANAGMASADDPIAQGE